MWTLHGRARRGFCDGVSRRDFLKIGGLALGGMSLPQLLAAEAHAGVRHPHKAIIMVFLPGGPPHQDLVDLKPDAPAEIRGEFRPIATNVPGLEVCELMPRLAAMMDKFAVIRSIVGARGEHDAEQCLTGYSRRQSSQQGGRPSLGAVLSKLQGPVDPSVPPFVGLSPPMGHVPWANPGNPGYLGLETRPLHPQRGRPGQPPEEHGRPRPTRRPQGAAREPRPPASRHGHRRRDRRHGHLHAGAPSTSSRRAPWSRRSTCRGRTRGCGPSTASAT